LISVAHNPGKLAESLEIAPHRRFAATGWRYLQTPLQFRTVDYQWGRIAQQRFAVNGNRIPGNATAWRVHQANLF